MPNHTKVLSALSCFFRVYFSLVLFTTSATQAQKIVHVQKPTHVQKTTPEKPATMLFQRLGSEQGLPQNSVRKMLQDRFGYLWFGTEDGLARFDGYNFVVFRHDPEDSTTLSNSYITALIEDRSGTLWVGTNGGGLNRFDRTTSTFKRYKHDPADTNGLRNNVVRTLLEDRSGMLWVGTFDGLYRFDRAKEKFVCYKNQPQNPLSLSNNIIRTLVEDRMGTLWIGTDIGLNRLDRTTGNFTRFQNIPGDSTSLSNNLILSMLEDAPSSASTAGILWIGTWDGGLNRFDCATGTFTHYRHNPNNPTSLSHNVVWSLLQDQSGTLWVGTWGNGLNRFNRSTGTFTRFQFNPADPNSLSNNLVLSLLEERSHGGHPGALWVGTGTGGLNRFDRITDAFVRYQHNFDDPTSLGDNVVRSLATDPTGTVWAGTSGGLNMLNKKTGQFTQFRHNPTDPQSISDNIVWSLLIDHTGTLWAGTEVGGLNRFNPTTKTFTHYKNNPTDSTSLSSNDVRALLEDHLGVIWVATLWKGVNYFDPSTNKFTRLQVIANDTTSISSNSIRSLYEDRSGTIWVGTGLNGLNRFNRATGTFTRYRHNPNDPTSISNNIIRCIMEDRSGVLWVGTHGGLNRFDRATGRFTVIREKDGLPNDVIYGIMEDERGNLWLSTNKGLCRLNPRTNAIANFDKRDGLQDNEFNGGAFARGHINGEMYFGGINGFNEFMPNAISTDTLPPTILLTMFRKFNRPAVLDSAIEEKTIITLPYSENSIGFEFVALSFRNAERNLYSYKLEGFDKNWSPSGAERKATYTNLEPGEYTFQVRGSNSDRIWNMDGRQIRVIILPPWWRTWWAYTAYTLCGIAIFMLLSIAVQRRRIQHLRAQQKEREEELLRQSNMQLTAANNEITRQKELVEAQNKHLQELDHEKNEMMEIVAHDLKSPLNGVRNLAALMEEYSETLPKSDVERYAQLIHESSNRMFQIVRSLLDVNSLEQGSLKPFFVEADCTELLRYLIDEYRERAAAKALTLHFDAMTGTTLFTDEMLLTQVMDNLLSNAVKYSPHGRNIWVEVKNLTAETASIQNGAAETLGTKSIVQISVRDEGPGFQDAEKHKLFGKFAKLSAQPTGGEHSTGLGLSIVKKMVEALRGRVWCESEAGKGATFIVELPVELPSDITITHQNNIFISSEEEL